MREHPDFLFPYALIIYARAAALQSSENQYTENAEKGVRTPHSEVSAKLTSR